MDPAALFSQPRRHGGAKESIRKLCANA